MIYTNVLSDILTEAGIVFESVGRGDGQSGLMWCGMPVQVSGISVDKLTEAQQALDAHPLGIEAVREGVVDHIKAGYAARIARGVTPAGKDFLLRADEQGQQRVSRFLTLLREAEDLQGDDAAKTRFRASDVPFDTFTGLIVTQSVAVWRSDMVSFGQQVLAIETQLATLLAAAQTETDRTILNAITWPDESQGGN